jgi:hypothetical protein
MSTNGYTIRLDLLKMAKELLEQDWHAHRDIVQNDYNNRVSLAFNLREHGEAVDIPAMPTFKPFPSEDQIIAKARVLNEFINQKQ